MKVKMTRTERAVRSADKVAKAAYKVSKAPTITEFFWDERDYMSPEELFWVDLDAACAVAQAPWDVKEQIAEYAKGLVCLKDNTVGQVIDRWLVQSSAPSWALTLDLYVGTYLPLVNYTIDVMTMYGIEIGNLEAEAHDVVRSFKEVPTEVLIDYHVLAYIYYAKIRVTGLGDFASFRYLWEKCGFSLHADKYQIASNRLRWWTEERADVHEYVYGSENGRYDFIGNTGTVMEAFNGFHIDVYKALKMTEGLTREQLIDFHLQGKIRMIKKHSIYPRDVFEAYGLPGYVPFLEGYRGGYFKAARKGAKALKAGLKPNLKALKAAVGIKGRVQYEQWTDVLGFLLLGPAGVGLNKSLHLEDASNLRVIPEHMKKLVAQNDRAIHWCFFTNLDIDWTVSKNSAKNCIIASLTKNFGYSAQEAEDMFNNPIAKEVVDFVKHSGPAVEEHTMPIIEDIVDEDGYKVSLLPKSDTRNLYIGELTACCQKLGGAGEDVCIEGWRDKHSANYVLTTASGKILSHFWLYETVSGGYVIDSVEARSSLEVEKLTSLVSKWVVKASEEVDLYISDCSYGITRQVITELKKRFALKSASEPAPAFKPEGHYEYRDSRYGVFSIN